MKKLRVLESFTFDDVLLRPTESRVESDDADVSTHVSKNTGLSIPILSTAMDTVTENGMAIGMAREGGPGVFHHNMNAEQMVHEIGRAKHADKLVIRREDTVTINPGQIIDEADKTMERAGVSGAPIVDDDDVVLGIISGTDICLYLEVGESSEVDEAMTDGVIAAEHDVTAHDAFELMHDHRIECALIVDDDSYLVGLVTMQGILQHHEHGNATRDDDGCLICGVAVSPFDDERAQMAGDAGADVIFTSCAHAYNLSVIGTVCDIRGSVETDVVVGNISTREATAEPVDFTDGIRIGVGPGSVYTIHVVSGSGVFQISAVTEAADIAVDHDIPVIADSGIRYSGDTIKAVAAGVGAVMFGSYFAGTDEAPGCIVTMNGKKYKQYRGTDSVGAMQSGGANRYLKEDNEDEEHVPEGIEAATPHKGSLASKLHQLIGGMQSGVGYVSTETIPEVREHTCFVRASATSQTEGHPHGVMTIGEVPNYSPSG